VYAHKDAQRGIDLRRGLPGCWPYYQTAVTSVTTSVSAVAEPTAVTLGTTGCDLPHIALGRRVFRPWERLPAPRSFSGVTRDFRAY
jgi:hypothetical protein